MSAARVVYSTHWAEHGSAFGDEGLAGLFQIKEDRVDSTAEWRCEPDNSTRLLWWRLGRDLDSYDDARRRSHP